MKMMWHTAGLTDVIIMMLNIFGIAQDTQHFTLTVEVHHLRNNKGVVQFALYIRDKTLPDENYLRAYKIGRSEVVDHSSVYAFTGLTPGSYAVNILHDENNNRVIDKGFLKPKEGIGFSNFSTVGLRNRPSFEKAKFAITDDWVIQIKFIYF